ncbi:hypothetical protein Q7M76_05140 [Candidatus Liberibacter asiaticus]|uniref:Transposase n=2 Tax=Liberibacter asiaticus TaxID=34021 RepID=C6XGW2_LIBAP|nr:hypothetical protein [Candidatus Liberibacter asiaticus]ACT57615.1 hypothetical protein CLIBASIA_05230 [Candidatus Liberibacter asiaticus str. psy62]AGH17379.1 hypothetical protein WSI_05085 [Candidatus Liberibacter asiaticus str. gxpsy]ALK07660.1 hypothetical protein CD16_05120 [Candidatus Liberibacter asiaticus]ASK53152.1 hypothetical protein B2I23_05185 [Candidatus Liberibacter asiaticus]AWL14473.1 hypothetical protein DIC79_05210 [Candidatus Liberibacter asiaticus]
MIKSESSFADMERHIINRRQSLGSLLITVLKNARVPIKILMGQRNQLTMIKFLFLHMIRTLIDQVGMGKNRRIYKKNRSNIL